MNGKTPVRPVVVAPTYNNAGTLLDVLRRVEVQGWPLIVVDDGSTDQTGDFLGEWKKQEHRSPVHVVTHERNRGKAVALRSGFAAAQQLGFTHAVTIDTDGQHDPEDIPRLVEAVHRAPVALILGTRSERVAGCPRSSLVGRYTSALAIWLETGRLVRDSQCGLRAYPLTLLDDVRCRAGRFGFEAEIITRASWADCALVEVPVGCRYFTAGRRVTHFKPWRDGTHGFLMHARLTLRRLNPWPQRVMRTDTFADPSTLVQPWRPTLVQWINPSSLWAQVRQDRLQQLIVAGAFGIGTFMACLPLGGWQTLPAVYAARRLHVHLLPVVIGAQIALPPVGDLLVRWAKGIGHGLLRGGWTGFATVDAPTAGGIAQAILAGAEWTLGAVFVGFWCNWITIGTLVLIFRMIPVSSVDSDEPLKVRS